MLEINLADKYNEYYDEDKQEFITKLVRKGSKIQLEHSLISISKWESKWHKPYLSSVKTEEQVLDYILCMALHPITAEVLSLLTPSDVESIGAYIDNPMTATTIQDYGKKGASKEVITSELLYYQMFAQGIPKECEKWHINRLIILIRVFNIKNDSGKKKIPINQQLKSQHELNEMRKKQLGTKG